MPEHGGVPEEPRLLLPMENEIMGAILNDNTEPKAAATAWLKANPMPSRRGAGRDHLRQGGERCREIGTGPLTIRR